MTFVGELFRNPWRTASLVPSSRELAALMTGEIDPNGGRVIELGGGTGVFTRALLELGLAPAELDVVEVNPVFAAGLRRDFPRVRVLEMNAETINRARLGPPNYQAAVSGLPLIAMRKGQQRAILEAIFSVLAPGGRLYQFTYAPRRPVSRSLLDEQGIDCDCIATSWRNVPPARVFRFQQRRNASPISKEIGNPNGMDVGIQAGGS